MPRLKVNKVLEEIRKIGVMRTKDFESLGLSRTQLQRFCRRGQIQRVGWGLYTLPNTEFSINHTLAQACKKVPHGIGCLLTALRFHALTTQSPYEVWLAIDPKARRPKDNGPPLRIVRFSGRALEEGVEEHKAEGIKVRVYSPAKTVADCFKYRNKIGLDVALEALKEGWRERRFTMDQLWRYAKICRVSNIMRPYLESLSL